MTVRTDHPHIDHAMAANVRMRSPRSVLLFHPFHLPIHFSLFIVSIIFTLWPESLEHAPVAFETRGVIHHAWHYGLLLGSGLTVLGLFQAGRRRLKVELIGLVLVFVALTMNLIALAFHATDEGGEPLNGLQVAVRLGVITGVLVRVYILAAEPVLAVPPTGQDDDA